MARWLLSAPNRISCPACAKTPTPGIPDDHKSHVRLMIDLIVVAFQSDATRVCTFMPDYRESNRYFNFIPEVLGTWHVLSHYKNASGKTEDDNGVTFC